MGPSSTGQYVAIEDKASSIEGLVQGKPVARRGRKARDLPTRQAARLPDQR